MAEDADEPNSPQELRPSDGDTPREEWERLPANPDLRDDLGYELFELEAYETDDGQVLVLPTDEDMLREDAFMVVGKDDICILDE